MHKPLKTWLLAGLAATPLILGSVGPATAAVPLVQTVQWHHGWHGDGGGGWHGGGWRRHEAWRAERRDRWMAYHYANPGYYATPYGYYGY